MSHERIGSALHIYDLKLLSGSAVVMDKRVDCYQPQKLFVQLIDVTKNLEYGSSRFVVKKRVGLPFTRKTGPDDIKTSSLCDITYKRRGVNKISKLGILDQVYNSSAGYAL